MRITDELAGVDDGAARRHATRALLVFGLGSFLAVALGTLVIVQAGEPLALWIRNPAGWLVMAGVSIFLASRGWLGAAMATFALAVVALSLFGPEQEGVRRWLDLGPVQMNAAALVLPVAIAAFDRTGPVVAGICFAAIAGILAVQPDISQLAAFAPAALVLFAGRFGLWGAVAALVVGGAAIAFCLTRPDPLEAVLHVEGIVQLAWAQSPALAMAMGAALILTAVSPLLLVADRARRWPALALTVYFAVTIAASQLAPYPVPLAGYGLSFVIGWWLGAASLTARRAPDV